MTVCVRWQLWLPDSPRWLMFSGRGRQDAQMAVQRLRGKFAAPAAVEAEVQSISTSALQRQRSAGDILGLCQNRDSETACVSRADCSSGFQSPRLGGDHI